MSPCPRPESGMCGLPDPETRVPCWALEGHDGPHWPWDVPPANEVEFFVKDWEDHPEDWM